MYMRWLMADWISKRKSKRKNKSPVMLTFTILALSFVLSACTLAPQAADAELIELIDPPKISQKPEYTVANATIETKVSATGKLMSKQQESLYFVTDNKKISEIFVKPGETVSEGQVIAVIETGNLETQVKRKEIEKRQSELNLIEKLKDDGRSPVQQELDKLDYEILSSELDELKAELEASRIKAPFDGTLVSFAKKVGDSVKAFETVGLFADLSQLTVAARFNASDLESVVVGMEAVVNINTIGSHTGKVSRLPLATSTSNNEDSLDLYVLIELDAFPSEAQANTPLSAAVITERKENAVLIPPAALRTVSGRNYVQVIDKDGNKSEVDVEVGLSTATEVEIVKGLSPGQKVIGK